MSSQPPWETQIQPGWGSQPQPPEQPPQPPRPPRQDGGWNQGAYTPPQPPQRAPQQPPLGPPPGPPGPPAPQPGAAFQQYPLQPPPPQFTPPQLPGMGPFGDEPPPKNKNTGRILAIFAAVVVLAGGAGGIYLLTKGGKSTTADTRKPPAATTATASATVPNNSYTGSAAPPAAAPSTSTGASQDNANTDKTPFTPDAMVAKTFVDEKKVGYELKFAQPQPCDKVGDAAVQAIVKSAPCTNLMAASWIDPANSRIVVSAMIIPYPDAATASDIYKKLGATHTGDYAQWCPPAGQPGADTCTKLAKTPNATREGKFGSFHRYVLITTAVYADVRNSDAQKDWLTAAARGAFQNTLPGQ